jgi:parvulin-like peptidyl-prolyl isomerase
MKKIIISGVIAFSTLSIVLAQGASTTIATGGDEKLGMQVKALMQEQEMKIQAIREEYRLKIKAIMDARKLQMASSTPKNASSTQKMREDKKREDDGRKKEDGQERNGSTFDRIKEALKMRGEVKGVATTTLEDGKKGILDFLTHFFSR